MRHLWSLVAGVVAAPLAWLLLAAGQHRSQELVAGWVADQVFETGSLAGPVAYLAVAGIGLGVLATLRWSPLGPLAAGLLLIIPTVLMFLNPLGTMDAFFHADQPRRVLGVELAPWLPVENGTLLILGSLLLVAVVSGERWRSQPAQPRPLPPATDDEVIAGISELTGRPGAGAAGPGASSTPMSSTPTASTPTASTPMTDEEILAAAATYEGTDTGQAGAGQSTPAPEGGTMDGTGASPESGTESDPGGPDR